MKRPSKSTRLPFALTLLTSLAACAGASGSHEQLATTSSALGFDNVTWTRLEFGLNRRFGPAMAFDSARGVVVLFGGMDRAASHRSDTWEWDGTAWHEKAPAHHPPARVYSAMAFDSVREKMVLFGGTQWIEGPVGGTWEYDGVDWTERLPATSPPVRSEHSLAFDSARGRTVLYGGWAPGHNGGYNDTWEWDGTNWLDTSKQTNPGIRYDAAMTYDAERGYTLLHGGYGAAATSWKWNGSSWTNTNISGPTLKGHAMVNDSDRKRVVMFSYGSTWEWDGSQWAKITTTTVPPIESYMGAAYDAVRHRTVLMGGQGTLGVSGDTWTYDGGDWTLAAPSTIPQARYEAASIFDPTMDATLMFGGVASHNALAVDALADTWKFDGSRWNVLTPGTSPSKRGGHVLVFDSMRAQGVLFGGHSSADDYSGWLSDTWLWWGNDWHTTTPQHSPPARTNAAAAFDPSRGYVVLFGGLGAGGYLKDTWLWAGSDWSQVTPAHTPLATNTPSMTYDSARQRVVLYQGSAVWEWDGADWQTGTATPLPPSRTGAALTFDSDRGRAVLFGGYLKNSYTNETWESDGLRWLKRNPPASPASLYSSSLVYDPTHHQAMLFGGWTDRANDATYIYRVEPGPNGSPCSSAAECSSGFCADDVCCSSACGGSIATDCQACSVQAGAPVDGTCTVFTSARTCRASAGVCDIAETCNGIDTECPANAFRSATDVCHAKSGTCDAEITCTGASASCPPTHPEPAGIVCGVAESECRPAAECNGVSTQCPGGSRYAPNGTPCGPNAECQNGGCEHLPEPDPTIYDAGDSVDAGSDSGVVADAGEASDASTAADAGIATDSGSEPSSTEPEATGQESSKAPDTRPIESAGCGCRVLPTTSLSNWSSLAIGCALATGFRVRRRRRQPERR